MDRAEMINSLAVAMGVKPAATGETAFNKKYNTSTGTIYCNKNNEEEEEKDNLFDSVSLFPTKRMAM